MSSTRSEPLVRAWDDPRVVFPDEETWARLSPMEREAVIERILGVLEEYREAMSEGVRHFRRKAGAGADLDGHFRRAGRGVFVACELAVFYPREPVMVPDVLAVMDCDPDIEPESWVVQDQGRGIDLVIEVRNLGRKHKDVVDNVRDYARRRIPEYFSFDCRRSTLRGWRLAGESACTYQPIVPQAGYLPSQVLGLDLAVVDSRLRFFINEAMVPNERELAVRLQGVVEQQRTAVEEVAQERDRAAQERDDAIGRMGRAQAALANGVLELCRARGLTLDDDLHARVVAESDIGQLTRWMTRAASAADGPSIFAEP
ncbi:MAG: Uma2 family endonuclease [Deltaproteobacteria bacterium]|nr:Uma2 family endonuclease [Myxococcales bacterium]MDP3214812.1 Uma2 family endonuclease [Deltaproteobacteria bacterium]